MKLKYYLRGIGLGIVVTAFIMSITNGMKNEKITDTQIIQRAIEFGMVTQEDYDLVKQDLSQAKNHVTDLENQLNESQSNQQDDKENVSETSNEETQDNTADSADTSANNETTKVIDIAGSTSELTTVTFNITPGMSSEAVANLLEEKGIIADAKDFNDYIKNSENENNMQIGEYEVKTGDSYDTIMGKITGR
jgi:hypothetical protein